MKQMHCEKGWVKDGTQTLYGKTYNKCIRKKSKHGR